jgi:large subunit ribosomal protein L10
MPLSINDKRAIVTKVNDIAKRAHSAIIAEYSGITVAEMTELRQKARAADVYLRVVRNTLARRAVSNTEFECLQDGLIGPVFLAFSMKEPGAAARVLKDFGKTQDKVIVKSIGLGGQLLEATDIDKVAKLPTYPQAISLLMSVMQAPVTQLVRTIAEPHAKLARTIAAIRDSKSN